MGNGPGRFNRVIPKRVLQARCDSKRSAVWEWCDHDTFWHVMKQVLSSTMRW
ncbi:hypothetical protein O9992_05155 [Vibrio lentus]|nr:hypothetical protein [Vibrio lentus]